MTYEGLTISEKPALLDAKARGAEWVARDEDGQLSGFEIKPSKMIDPDCIPSWWSRWQKNLDSTGWIMIENEFLLPFVKWSDAEPMNIDLALAQIAEMERIAGMEEMLKTGDATTKASLFPAYFAAKANEQTPLTWNERINQMTVEEKARFIQFKSREMYQKAMDYAWKFRKTGKLTSYYTERMIELLNSPYTEGETK